MASSAEGRAKAYTWTLSIAGRAIDLLINDVGENDPALMKKMVIAGQRRARQVLSRKL